MVNGLINSFLSLSGSTKTIVIILWTIIIVSTIIIELQTSDLVSCWFGLSGIVCLILSFCSVDIVIQLVVFAVLSTILVIATRPLLKKFNNNEEIPTNVDKLIGMIGVVTKKILVGEKGEVKVNYQKWTAICKNGYSFEEGQKVLIKEIEGNKLVVDIIEEIEIK